VDIMSNSITFVSDVSAAASGHWPHVLGELGINIPQRGKHGPCPVCGGKDRFRFDDKEGRGTFICNECKAGDGLDLVAKATGKPLKEAAAMVAPLVGLDGAGMDPAERECLQKEQQARAAQERKQGELMRKKAARRAAAIMQDCEWGQSPYLVNKGLRWPKGGMNRTVIAIGEETFPAGSAVVSLTDEAGYLVNVQLIRDDGTKCYLAGGQKGGAFHRIDGGELVALVEGYATGLSAHLTTGATVYCAMDCGNLMKVAGIARRQHPNAVILVCGDNDATTTGNPGKTKAMQAAQAVGAWVSLPPVTGDWNDYHQAYGRDDTRAAIMGVIPPKPLPADKPKAASQKKPKGQQAAKQIIQGGAQGASVEPNPVSAVQEGDPGYLPGQQEDPAAQVHDENDDLPEGFIIKHGGLYGIEWVGRGEEARREEVLLSPVVRVLARTANERGYGHGKLLEWQDSKGRLRQWAMPMDRLIQRGGEAALVSLVDGGLAFVNMEKRNKFTRYLMMCQPEREITCVEHTGWHDGTYVLPNGGIGPNAGDVILQSGGYMDSDFTGSGELADWQRQIAAVAVGNSRLGFALSLAFAAPLLSLVGLEGGGFHLKGESTDGKSTIMKAAASVYGQPDRYSHTWRATGNAIEGIAGRRNDALLCLDELGELDGREAGQVAYMLANGQGKGRSRQDGELRERKAWRLLFLSTGELSLEDHAAEAGKRTQAGMEVRTIQIPSGTGKYGAFEALHSQPDGRAFADALNDACKHHYGTPFRAYAGALAAGLDTHRERLKADIKRLAMDLTPVEAGNQVGRAINRFALVAAAGELATELGITGWPQGEATRAVRVCLKAWLDERGYLGNKEDKATRDQVRGFVVSHQFSRFADWFDPNHRPANMVGYRKVEAGSVSFIVLPSAWAEITKGRDPKRAALLCVEAGYLLVSNDKKRFQRRVRLPGMKSPSWAYVLTDHVLADSADGPEDE
jgi:putative DNA primase/helicase